MPTAYRKMTPEQKARSHACKKRWADRNREKIIRYKRTHYHENRDKYLTIERERSYGKLYGITIADYDRMYAEQEGRCAICQSTETLKGSIKRHFSVDHCHATGAVRGLLCVACNHLLGRYEKHADAIMAYLAAHKTKQGS